tara:strand:+ start:1538 stop:4870 length:3333 start_codon:yes stop_codon:yes gene_type:complete
MGRILLRTPQGEAYIDIEGDSPTSEEQTAIVQQFYSNSVVPSTPSRDDIDLGTASIDEIRDYIRAKEQMGIDATTGEAIAPEDMKLKDPGVDYATGLNNFSFRRKLGAKDTAEEKEVFLQEQVGTDGYRKDRGGRFIITQKGRSKLGLTEGPELAIDEESLSRYDFADFAGQSGVPLATGVGAGLLLSGTGFMVAAPVVGAVMGVSKLLEEAYETTQGYQRQSQDEINRAAALEAVFGIAGEGIGRGVSAAFGRILKGSGSKQAELARVEGRELLEKGFKPTVEGAIPGVRPVLNRLQAIYEGIFPNGKAADDNLNIILKDLTDLEVAKSSVDSLETAVKKDINEMFGTADARVKEATRKLNKEIEADIKAIIEPLKKGEKITDDAIQKYINSKRIFEEESDALFSKATRDLGTGNKVIPVAGIKKAFDLGVRTLPDADKVSDTQLSKMLTKAVDEDNGYVTPEDAQLIQKIIGNLGNSDEFRSTVKGGLQANLKRSVREAFSQGEKNLNYIVNNIDKVNAVRAGTEIGSETAQKAATYIDTFFASKAVPKSEFVDKLREGLSLLQKSQSYYRTGMKRFGDPIVEKLFKETEAGTVPFDSSKFLPEVIENNAPEQLKRYLRALRGAPIIRGLQTGEVTLARSTISGEFGEKLTVEQAERLYASMPDLPGKEVGNQTKKRLFAEIQRVKNSQAKVKQARENARQQGTLSSESARQSLARSWIQREIEDPGNYTTRNGVEVFDGIRFAKKIEELGSTKGVLFKGQLDSINKLTTILKQTGAEIDPKVMAQFADEGIAGGIRALKETVENQTAFNTNSLLRSLQANDAEGISKQLFQRQNASRVRAFKEGKLELRTSGGKTVTTKDFGDIQPETFAAVQDASMRRIIRSLGDMDTPDFREKFVTGSLGSNFQSTLNGYGRETVTAMFGKEASDGMFKLADNMVSVSNAPISGKGGLAAPNIALGLGIYGLLTAPFATIPAAAFYLGMSKALRTPVVLRSLTASRKPGGDQLGTALQVMESSMAKAMIELGYSSEGASVSPEIKQNVDQVVQNVSDFTRQITPKIRQATQQLPNVLPPSPASSASTVSPMSLNPIVTPDPRDRALAEQLMNRPR